MEYQVSIIIRTKDRGIFLKRAIEDILNQTYKDWIIILINDGGNKLDLDIILDEYYSELSSKLIVVNLLDNIGLHKSINKAIKYIKTEYVVTHDDDDTWENLFLEKTIFYLEQSGCMGVVTHSNIVKESIKKDKIVIKKIKPFNYSLNGVIPIHEMLQNNLFPPISFVYRSKVFDYIGLYDENYKVLEDWDFYIRFILKYDIHVISESLSNYHIRVGNNKVKSYKNTVIDRKKEHIKFSNIIRNRYIRYALEKGDNINLGQLMYISSSNECNNIKHTLKKILRIIN